jgi:hypothetical protein
LDDKYYEPGKCNINDEEARFKVVFGFLFIVMAIALAVAIVIFVVPPLYGLSVILPVWIGAMQFLQVKNRFCATMGIKGFHNASIGRGKKYLIRITDQESRLLDKAKSKIIVWQALGFASIATFAYVGIMASRT